MKASNTARIVELACIGALAVVCAWQLQDLERVLDLEPWDEADYLRRGLALWRRGLPAAEWGPLYSVWYFALSRLVPDPSALYYLSYRLLVVIPTFGVYACARRLGVSPAIALLGALLFVISGAPHVMPRPTLLALSIILVALAGAARLRWAGAFYAVMGVALLLAAFARPELFLSFLAASGAGVIALVNEIRQGRSPAEVARNAGAYAGGCLALMAVFGNPFGNQDDRRMYAFCQHFADGEVKRSGLAIDPWAQCEAAMQQAFGDVKSIAEAARRNPAAFRAHVTDNLRAYPAASVALFLRGFSEERVADEWPPARIAHVIALLVAAAWLLWTLFRHGVGLAKAARSPTMVRAAFVVVAVLVPSATSAILIQPRNHYLVLQGVMVTLVVAAWASAAIARRPAWQLAPAAITVGLAAVVALAAPQFVDRAGSSPVLANREMVRFLESATREFAPVPGWTAVGVLEMEGGLDAYASTGRFRRIRPSERLPTETFRQFIERRAVQVVIFSPKLNGHHRLAADPEFEAFVSGPEAFGFSKAEVPEVGRAMALRREGKSFPPARALLNVPGGLDPG